jgi:hypothetical protein
MMEEQRNWEVCWTQGLLIFAGIEPEWETLEANLTQAEAEGEKLQEHKRFLAGAVGVLIKARQSPPQSE